MDDLEAIARAELERIHRKQVAEWTVTLNTHPELEFEIGKGRKKHRIHLFRDCDDELALDLINLFLDKHDHSAEERWLRGLVSTVRSADPHELITDPTDYSVDASAFGTSTMGPPPYLQSPTPEGLVKRLHEVTRHSYELLVQAHGETEARKRLPRFRKTLATWLESLLRELSTEKPLEGNRRAKAFWKDAVAILERARPKIPQVHRDYAAVFIGEVLGAERRTVDATSRAQRESLAKQRRRELKRASAPDRKKT